MLIMSLLGGGGLFLIYINHVSSVTLTDGSKLTMHADDILLNKPISHPVDYSGLQTGLIENTGLQLHQSLNFESTEMQIPYLFQKETTPPIPPTGLLLGGVTLEHVESYCYLGVLVTSRLTWSDHIEQICTKARKLVELLYR